MKHLTSAVLLIAALLASNTHARCLEPSKAPNVTVPSGETASNEAMAKAQQETIDYVSTVEDYVACNHYMRSDVHNRWVKSAQEVANTYNTELHQHLSAVNLSAAN